MIDGYRLKLKTLNMKQEQAKINSEAQKKYAEEVEKKAQNLKNQSVSIDVIQKA